MDSEVQVNNIKDGKNDKVGNENDKIVLFECNGVYVNIKSDETRMKETKYKTKIMVDVENGTFGIVMSKTYDSPTRKMMIVRLDEVMNTIVEALGKIREKEGEENK